MWPCSACSAIATNPNRLPCIDGGALLHTNEGKMTIGNLYVAMTKRNEIAALGLKSSVDDFTIEHGIYRLVVGTKVNTGMKAALSGHRMPAPSVG